MATETTGVSHFNGNHLREGRLEALNAVVDQLLLLLLLLLLLKRRVRLLLQQLLLMVVDVD